MPDSPASGRRWTRAGSRRWRSRRRRSSGLRCSGATWRFPSPIVPCSSTSTTGRASHRSARKRRGPSPTTSLVASHTGNTRDAYLAQDPGPRAQVEDAVRPRGALPRSRDAECGVVQPALDRARRGRRPVRRGRQQLRRPSRGRRGGESRVRASPLRGGAAASDRADSRRQLHHRAPCGARQVARGARARRLEPDAVLFQPGSSRLADELGALLICDEMITGFGRTGKMFAIEHEGVIPDVITVGKGFGGGFPMSGLIAREEVAFAKPFANPSGSSSSYGGNPLAAAAARVTIETILEEDLVEHSRRLGAKMLAEMRRWESEVPIVSDVRGRGLLIGLDLVVPGTRTLLDKRTTRWIFDTLLSRGVLAMIYNPEVRINPPLVIEEDQAMGALATMKDVLGEAAERLVG